MLARALFQRVLAEAVRDIDSAHLDAVLACIADLADSDLQTAAIADETGDMHGEKVVSVFELSD